MKIKDILAWVAIATLIIVFAFVFMFAVKRFNSATTSLIIHEPEPGIRCASMTTTDGVALSCWKDN